MRTGISVVLVVAGLSATPMPYEPAPQPDFSGAWLATRDTPASVAVAPSAVFGDRFGLTVGSGEVTLARLLRGASVVSVIPTNGTEVRTDVPGRPCMGDSSFTATLTREGAAFALTLATRTAGAAQTGPGLKYFLRMESADTLVVESTIREDAQAPPRQVGTLYRRSSDPMPPPMKGHDVKGVPATIADAAWIAGDWAAPLGTATMEERWSNAAGGAMLAVSRTTRAGTMSAFEFLCIAERAGSLVYTAMPNAGPATDFMLTSVDATSATFENPAHDFPKKIRYAKRADGGFDATISAGSRATTFAFARQK